MYHSKISHYTKDVNDDLFKFAVPPSVAAVQPLPVVVGTTIVLVCDITGVDPPDTITWTFNSVEVSTNSSFTLTVTDVNHGVYTCTASNEFGSSNSSIEIMLAGMSSLLIFSGIHSTVTTEYNVFALQLHQHSLQKV